VVYYVRLDKKELILVQYDPLSVVYYKNPMGYEQLHGTRSNGEHTVHLPVKIQGVQAFFCVVPEILLLTEKIYRTDREISELWREIPRKSKSRHYAQSLIEEALWTNDIEGIQSSRQELRKAFDVATKKSNQATRFKGLLAGYIGMINHDLICVKSPQDVREIYNMVLLNDISDEDRPDGKIFRKDNVSVVSSSGKEVHHGIMPESDLTEFVTEILNFVEDEHYSLASIAVFHYLFGYAHPFYDGNGRMARFLSSLFLSENLHLLIGLNMSQTISEGKSAYYKAFDVCNDPKSKGDITPFVLYYLSKVAQSASVILSSLEEAAARFRHYLSWLEKVLTGTAHDVLRTILEVTLFSEKGIGADGIGRYLEISTETVRSYLRKLQITDIPITFEISDRKKLYRLDLEKIDRLEESI
jgi:Fic family protein